MDAASLILGFALASAGGGMVALLRSKKKLTAAMCPCGHEINFHAEKGTGACLVVLDRVEIGWKLTPSGFNRPVEWEERRCACQMYSGPELLRGFQLPEVRSDDA